MLTIKIYLDLETLPPEFSDEEMAEFEKNLSPPKTIKDPAKIEKWLKENTTKKYRELGAKPSSATIATFAYAFDDGEVVCAYSPERDESAVINSFYEDLQEYIEKNLPEDATIEEANVKIQWIGWNCRRFDLDILWKRSIFYGNYDFAKIIPRERYDKNIIDLMEVWVGPNYNEYAKQDTVCKYFNIEGKPDDIDGSMVYDYWMAGEYEKVAEYNRDDVEKVRKLHKKIFA